MAFFDETIDPRWLIRPAGEKAPAAWWGPPHNVVPRVEKVAAMVTRAPDLAIWLADFEIFPSGYTATLHVRWRSSRRIIPPLVPGERGRRGLCVGVILADGRRTVAVTREAVSRTAEPREPILVSLDWRFEYGQAEARMWLWPLASGSVTWVVEWRAQRVAESRIVVDHSGRVGARLEETVLWGRDDTDE
jgi:hypothetical protein